MKYLHLILLLFIVSCGSNGKRSSDDGKRSFYEVTESTSKYPDDTYCADVTYYNPSTGTRNTYTLNVEVEDNELVKILWTNGGWLDDSHFSPQELDSDGSCSFTSDKGYRYEITITGSECSRTDERKVQADKEESTCPKCGDEKDAYDEYCYYCKRKIENEKEDKEKDIEEHTCKKCGEYDSFMFSSDDLCSDCERKIKQEQQDEEDKKEEEKRRKKQQEEEEESN